MELAKIQVNGVHAYAVYRKHIPAGIIGATVSFEFDSTWDGLTKTVVFKGAATKDVLNAGSVVTIPAEVVAKSGGRLEVGVYGVDADGTIAIPTLWADLGFICRAADPSGDASTDPQLPIWAQLDARVEKLERNGAGGGEDTPAVPVPGGNAATSIPAGGKAGQYLCKQSDEDYDVAWCDLVIPEQYGLITYDQNKTITIT